MIGFLLIFTVAMFEPETRLVSYVDRNAWLAYPGQYPVAIDEGVVSHLVWYSDYGAYASYALWYGERVLEWSDFEKIYYNKPEYSSHPSIAAVNRYKFFVAWDGKCGHRRIFLLRTEGWGDRIVDIISPDTLHSFTPSLALDGDTSLHIVWQGERNILHRSFKDGILSPITALSQSPYAVNPTIASFGNTLAVAWSDLKNGVFDIYLRVFDDEWEDEMRVSASSGSSRFPVITYDSEGILHIVYMDDRNGGYKLYYNRYDGNELGEEELVVDTPGEAYYPSLTATPDGSIHLAWSDNRDGNYEIYYKTIGSMGMERITDAEGSSSYPVIVSDVEGGLWLFYRDRRNTYGEIYYTTSPPPRRKTPPSLVFPNPSNGNINISSEPLKVYDVSGRYIGTYTNSIKLSPGVYFLLSPTESRKVVVIR